MFKGLIQSIKNSCVKLSILLLGKNDKNAANLLHTVYKNLPNVTTLNLPNYDCLSYLFYCILPCSSNKPECMQEDIDDCQTLTASPNNNPNETLHVWCVFAFNLMLENNTFEVIFKTLKNGIQDYITSHNIQRYRIRFVLGDTEITNSYEDLNTIESLFAWNVPINDSILNDTFHMNERLSLIPWSGTLTKTRPGIYSVIILTNYATTYLKTVVHEQNLEGQMYIYNSVSYSYYSKVLKNDTNFYLYSADNSAFHISITPLTKSVAPQPSPTLSVTTTSSKTPTKYATTDFSKTTTTITALGMTSVPLQNGHNPSSNNTTKIYIISGTCVAVLIVILIFGFYCFRKRQLHKAAVAQLLLQHRHQSLQKHFKTSTSNNDEWELTWEKLNVKYEIGTGTYGKILYGKLRSDIYDDGVEVAIKMDFINEINMTKSISGYTNVVKMLGCITVGDEICLVLEFCSNLDLHAFLKDLKVNKKELEEDQKVVRKEFFIFAWQISHGLQYLASQEIIHRNLTAKNILVDSEKNAKICDFGLAIHESQTNEFISTSDKRKLATKWLAIECFENDEFSYKSDIWAFGIVLYEIYSFGEIPYAGIETEEQQKNFLKSGKRLEKPDYCSDEIFEIMKKFWLEDPVLRPTATEINAIFKRFLEQSTEGYGYLEVLETAKNKNNKELVRQFTSLDESKDN